MQRSPLDTATELTALWSSLGFYKGLSLDDVRGELVANIAAVQGAVMPPKRQRKPKTPEIATETPKTGDSEW